MGENQHLGDPESPRCSWIGPEGKIKLNSSNNTQCGLYSRLLDRNLPIPRVFRDSFALVLAYFADQFVALERGKQVDAAIDPLNLGSDFGRNWVRLL